MSLMKKADIYLYQQTSFESLLLISRSFQFLFYSFSFFSILFGKAAKIVQLGNIIFPS